MAKVEHLIPLEPEGEPGWSKDLKDVLSFLVDMGAAMIANRQQPLALREVLTPEDLSSILKIPESTVMELTRRGKIPGAFRVGKHWRYDADLLRQGLARKEPDE